MALDVRTTLGGRIKAARAYAGISQSELEARLWPDGSGAGRMSRYESDQRGQATIDPVLLDDMARVLGVEYRWLSVGRGHMLGSAPIAPPPSPAENPER